MTETELKAKWTETQFNEWKLQGIISAGVTYHEYLAMRREQETLRERQLQEILADYGTLPNEEPPDMDEEDFAALELVWQTVAQEKSREKLAA